jgi:hypothetical protein
MLKGYGSRSGDFKTVQPTAWPILGDGWGTPIAALNYPQITQITQIREKARKGTRTKQKAWPISSRGYASVFGVIALFEPKPTRSAPLPLTFSSSV